MANPFDQFDAPAPKSGANPFDQFDTPQVTQGEAFMRGVGQGASLGFGDELASVAAAGRPRFAGAGQPETDAERQARELFGGSPSITGVEQLGMGVRDLARGNPVAQADYNQSLGQERALDKAASDQFFWTNLAGNIAGGAALPVGSANTVAGMAKTGAAMGGVYGFGTGEGTADRLAQAGTGAALGGAAGALIGKIMPRQGAAPVAQPVAEAGERIGVPIMRGVASESPVVQSTTQKIQAVPLVGKPIREGMETLVDDLGRAADRQTGRLGSGERFISGDAAASSIRDWMGPKSKAVISRAYEAVDGAIDPSVKTPLTSTLNIANEILSSRQASFTGDSSAVAMVRQAIQQGDGLTYEGVKNLRTQVGEMLKPGRLPAGTDGTEMKRIFGALSDDLRAAVRNAGGPRAEQLFNRANSLNAKVAERRKELARIVGADVDQPAETVFDRMVALASDRARGNIDLLAKARKAVGPEEWREFSSGVAARLGRAADGEFSPDLFVRDWGKLAPNAKSILFDDVTKNGLDDIATISTRIRDMRRASGNPSGTAQNVLPMAAVVTALSSVSGAVKTGAAMTGGALMSKFLASPASVSSAAKWSRAYEAAIRKPVAGSLASLNVASRNLAGTLSDQLGVKVTAENLLRAISGLNPSRADSQQPNQDQPEQ